MYIKRCISKVLMTADSRGIGRAVVERLGG
jgi:NAD(P)-dependent dehydrogenase (short-subunit alcohol dehydrogenase family)